MHKKAESVPCSEEEWKQKLTPEQYQVLREKGTSLPEQASCCEQALLVRIQVLTIRHSDDRCESAL